MAYPPIFWDCVRNVFVFHAVSETQIASDLGLDRKHLREVARKMEWEKSRRKPSIPELIRLRNFYEAHTLERKRPDAVRTQIKEATEMHNWMVELALLFKHREFDSMEGVNGYLKRQRIALADLLLERFQKRYWGDDDTLRRDRGVLGGSFAGKI